MTLDEAMQYAEREIDAALVASWDALALQLIADGLNPNDRGSCGATAPPSSGAGTWVRVTFHEIMTRQREHDRRWRAATLADLRERFAAIGLTGA